MIGAPQGHFRWALVHSGGYMGKIVFSLVLFLLLVVFVFLNLGKWIDVTEKPVKADIIVCLGGGTVERLNMAVDLFNKGYIRSESVMLIGESYDTTSYLEKTYPYTSIEQHHEPKNTKEEVLYIKRYMVKYGYKSVLIVTDPPHSRRVSLLHSLLDIEGDDDIDFHMVSSKVLWWNEKKYYDDDRSGKFVFAETIRILYSVFCYGIVERFGVKCA